MAFPPKCGNWVHLPIDIPRDDPDWKALASLGFRGGRLCKKHAYLWQHVHPPAGWHYSVNAGGVAIIWDKKWRKRVLIAVSNLEQNTKACMFVLRYFNIRAGGYVYDYEAFVVMELYGPDETIHLHAFTPAPLGEAFDLKPYILQMHSLARRDYPLLTDPLAYWDNLP